MQLKTCSKCGEEKEISEFHKDKAGKYGVHSKCKMCRISPEAQRRLSVPKGFKLCCKCKIEKPLSKFHKDVSRNDDLRSNCKECNLKEVNSYHLSHKQESKDYYIVNREKILKQTNEYKEHHKQERHEYYLKNKHKLREQNRISRKKRLENNIQAKLASVIRTTICIAIKKNRKYGKSIELLGCSIDFLKKHLEAQFKENMSWNNYGRGWYGKKEWHIDHINPIDNFDLTIKDNQLKCFHYTNLQPLWAKENLIKYNKTGD